MISFPLAHINAYFVLDGTKYEIENFATSFRQPADFKGQPQHETKGGELSITIGQQADDNLYLWAKKSTLQKSGQILFQTDLGITILRISFENAYCITLTREISSMAGTQTLLVLSPESISMNGHEFDRKWKK